MEAARILILGVAFSAGGAAAFLIGPGEEKKPQTPRAVQEMADMLPIQGNSGRLFDASTVAKDNTDRDPAPAPFRLVSAANK